MNHLGYEKQDIQVSDTPHRREYGYVKVRE